MKASRDAARNGGFRRRGHPGKLGGSKTVGEGRIEGAWSVNEMKSGLENRAKRRATERKLPAYPFGGLERPWHPGSRGRTWWCAALCAVVATILARTAWMSDDAFITLRTVDNLVNGYGLRWNVSERVQAFTHPLWMFLLTPAYFLTREPFYTTIVLSVIASIAAVGLLLHRSRSPMSAVVLAGLLLSSRSFVDYSTSGLENPVTHLLFAAYLLGYPKRTQPDRRRLLFLAGLAGLAALNRIDSLLLFLPGLVLLGREYLRRSGVSILVAGFAPFLLWEVFAVFYYGMPVPNTALAKLNTGIGAGPLLRHGIHYLANSLRTDPATLPLIAAGIALAAARRGRREMAIAAGVCLYLLYIVKIGGDFMSGRFLSAPLLAAAVLIRDDESAAGARLRRVILPAALVLASVAPHPSIWSGRDFGVETKGLIDGHGIADERRYYFSTAGMISRATDGERPTTAARQQAIDSRKFRTPVILEGAIGVTGYYAGPGIHIIDYHALADPLLCRLPIVDRDLAYKKFMEMQTGAEDPDGWRIGHFLRSIPAGYAATVLSGTNRIVDPGLRELYDRLGIVNRGPLWSRHRLAEIARLNLGRYDRLVDRQRRPPFAPPPWDEIIALSPDLPEPHYRRAASLYDAGRPGEALEEARRAVSMMPDYQKALALYGKIQRDLGDYGESIRSWEAAIRIDPTSAPQYVNLGDTYMRAGRPMEAIESFQAALRRDPSLAIACNNIGIAHSQLGDMQEAARWLNRALTLEPDSYRICEDLGNVYLNLGDRPRAIRMLERAVTLRPDLASAIASLGIAYADEGKGDLALRHLEKAISMGPANPEVADRLARLLDARGERDRAVRLWSEAAAAGYEPARSALRQRGIGR